MDDIRRILTALERRPLTVENLAYALGLPLEETREVMMRLWDEGYIDTTTSVSSGAKIGAITGSTIVGGVIGAMAAGIFGAAIGAVLGNTVGDQIVPAGRQEKRQKTVISDSQTYFILTSKGHYHLHPPTSL
ncbi:hypothetical protein A6770_23300 [Nostoc minutum NIES-26]|uniref:Glycine zipper domain-containing protein n=1 Tax=Nostoc minutum NIES-26 TaxID=1844469 RepID=A0A367QWF1_9NOSO|nr:hypothetical protein [Dendronalium sp. ChiSLP03b]MDZ8205630.1 hypothetical protein [Dendronalium sp. ChiSLP03b]RCJ28536.1 hypothetical protein A6770_23300 [Nostoc minutum NIES-26]